VTQNGFIWTAMHVIAVAMMSAVVTTAAIAEQPQQQSGGADQGKIDQGKIDLGKIDLGKIDLGKQTFAQKCSHCHGPNMINSGTITPDLRRFPDDEPRFVTTVKQGKNGRMPPWGDILNDDDIGALWAYVSSRRTP
jgi:mono/diheme cytochrome c family protein